MTWGFKFAFWVRFAFLIRRVYPLKMSNFFLLNTNTAFSDSRKLPFDLSASSVPPVYGCHRGMEMAASFKIRHQAFQLTCRWSGPKAGEEQRAHRNRALKVAGWDPGGCKDGLHLDPRRSLSSPKTWSWRVHGPLLMTSLPATWVLLMCWFAPFPFWSQNPKPNEMLFRELVKG